MAADGAHFLLTNDQIWERHPFSSLSVAGTSDFELRDVKTGKACLCHRKASSYHPCEHRDLVIRRATNRTAFSFFLRKRKAYSNRESKAIGSSKKKMAVIVSLKCFCLSL